MLSFINCKLRVFINMISFGKIIMGRKVKKVKLKQDNEHF